MGGREPTGCCVSVVSEDFEDIEIGAKGEDKGREEHTESEDKRHSSGGAFKKPIMEKLCAVESLRIDFESHCFRKILKNATLPLPAGMRGDATRADVRRNLAVGLVALVLVLLMVVIYSVQRALPEPVQELDPNLFPEHVENL